MFLHYSYILSIFLFTQFKNTQNRPIICKIRLLLYKKSIWFGFLLYLHTKFEIFSIRKSPGIIGLNLVWIFMLNYIHTHIDFLMKIKNICFYLIFIFLDPAFTAPLRVNSGGYVCIHVHIF